MKCGKIDLFGAGQKPAHDQPLNELTFIFLFIFTVLPQLIKKNDIMVLFLLLYVTIGRIVFALASNRENKMHAIEQINEDTYYLESRGNKMTLTKISTSWGHEWQMFTDNASRRAFRGLGMRRFKNLLQVETAYKSWRGIAALVGQ